MSENLTTVDDIERALIGSVLTVQSVYGRALDVLPNTFRQRKLGYIWKAIHDLHCKGDAIDIETVAHVLDVEGKLKDAGGHAELATCVDRCASTLHIDTYSQQVIEAAAKRSLRRLADKALKLSEDGTGANEALQSIADLTKRCQERAVGYKPLELLSADEILNTEWPEPTWAIPDLAPTGLAILAGKAKLGKSWLTLQIAQAVASGGQALGRKIVKGGVLYLALEDPPRRLQDRMKKQHWPQGLKADFMTVGQFWEQIGDLKNGGGLKLAAQIADKKYSYVVIDTLSKSIAGDQDRVDEMTQALAPIHEIAHKTNTVIFLVDHHKKITGANPDAVTDILGSTAKGAVSDTAWGLYRERGKAGARLQVTGRDIAEQNLALSFSPLTWCWDHDGDADELAITERRQEILDVLDNGSMGVSDIASAVGQNKGNIHNRLQIMVDAGLIERKKEGRRVFYSIKDEQTI